MPKKPKPPSPAAPVVADTPAVINVADTPAVVNPTPFAPAPPVAPAPPAPAPTPAPTPTQAPVPAPSPPAAPLLDVAAYQARDYPQPRCWSLVADVYSEVLGRDATEVQTVSESIRQAARTFRLQLHKGAIGLEQTEEPRDLAVVLMWPSEQRKRPHCGIYYGGRVLHATPQAVLYQDMASLGDSYQVMEFWQ